MEAIFADGNKAALTLLCTWHFLHFVHQEHWSELLDVPPNFTRERGPQMC